MRPLALGAACLALLAAGSLTLPPAALAHVPVPQASDLGSIVAAWSFEPLVWGPIILALAAYHGAVGRVNRAHPLSPVPRSRVWAWDAGLAVLLIALASPIATYDTVFFSVHMVQHLLLTMVAAPLLILGAPITLLLRVVRPDARRSIVLPILHSRAIRVISFPPLGWVLFALVMYGSHFSPLFDAALESEALHVLEHGLFLGTALLFWWPIAGADPSPWRLSYPARLFYLFLGMPWSSFLGLAIFSASAPLYAQYATLVRSYGPSPLEDQAWAGGIMWAGGDLLFLLALILAVAAWLRSEDAEGKRADARLDREQALAASSYEGGASSSRTATSRSPSGR